MFLFSTLLLWDWVSLNLELRLAAKKPSNHPVFPNPQAWDYTQIFMWIWGI